MTDKNNIGKIAEILLNAEPSALDELLGIHRQRIAEGMRRRLGGCLRRNVARSSLR